MKKTTQETVAARAERKRISKIRRENALKAIPPDILPAVTRLTKDLVAATVGSDLRQIGYIVDAYYMTQEHRIALDSQLREAEEAQEPSALLVWMVRQLETLEAQVKRALDAWSDVDPLASWAKSIVGIGPVISSGLRAHIDISRVNSAGQIWSLAGLSGKRWVSREEADAWVREHGADLEGAAAHFDRSAESLLRFATGEGQKLSPKRLAAAVARRPYNAELKKLCAFKLGESFVKVSGRDDSFYGKLYKKRKAEYIERNAAGGFAENAAEKLRKVRIGKDTEAYGYYSKGQLPPAHIHAMARRYVVKMFLSHYFEKGMELEGRPLPQPYVIAVLGHKDYVPYTAAS